VIAVESVTARLLKSVDLCWTRVLPQLQNRLQRKWGEPFYRDKARVYTNRL